jgi:hypothetical protein
MAQPGLDITRHNSSKKIAHLNSNVQFLQCTIEERLFQVEYLRCHRDDHERQHLAKVTTTIRKLFAGMDTVGAEIQTAAAAHFAKKLDTIRSALARKEATSQQEICALQQEVEIFVETAANQIKSISGQLNTICDFLNDPAQCDVAAIQSRVIQMKREHQTALRNEEFAAKRRLREFDEESRDRLKETEANLRRELELLRVAPHPQFSMAPSSGSYRKRIVAVKKEIAQLAAIVTHHRSLCQQNLVGFRTRFTFLLEQMSNEDLIHRTEFAEKEPDVRQETEWMTAALKKLRTEGDEKRVNYRNELGALKDQLMVVRINLRSEFDEHKESIQSLVNGRDSELIGLSERFTTEMNALKARHHVSEAQHLQVLEALQRHLDDGRRDVANSDIAEQTRRWSEQEIAEFPLKAEQEKATEEQNFRARIGNLQEGAGSLAGISAECMKLQQERKQLQAVLDSMNGMLQQKDMQFDQELGDDWETFPTILSRIEAHQNSTFELESALRDSQISDVERQFDGDFLRYQQELNVGSQREIELRSATLIDPEYERQFVAIETALRQKLDDIQIPQPLDLDRRILIAMRHHIDSLPAIIRNERSELIKKWEVLCREEEARHRQSLLAHFDDQRNDRHPDFDRSVSSELDRQIGELSGELHNLELLGPAVSFEGPFADAQRRLQDELDRKRRVCEAESHSQEVRSLLSQSIGEDISKLADVLRRETEDFERLWQQSRDEYEKQRLRRKEVADGAARTRDEIVDGFGRDRTAKETDFRLACRTLRERIEHVKLCVACAGEAFECARRDAAMQWEVEIGRLEGQMRDELQRNPMADQHLDVRVVERTKNRNKARDVFLNGPIRREEQTSIKRLERHLAVVTQQLAALGKELIQYRHQLVAQEGEYNCRFGADPTVAVLAPKSPKRRPTTMFANRLPRLSS